MAERSTTRPPLSRQLRQGRQAPVVEDMQPKAAKLEYTDEVDAREAASNFRQYLAILEEWDEREKEKEKAKGKLD